MNMNVRTLKDVMRLIVKLIPGESDLIDQCAKVLTVAHGDSLMVAGLESGGVDNWESYSESLREFFELDDEGEFNYKNFIKSSRIGGE